jgi:hypothetical protein
VIKLTLVVTEEYQCHQLLNKILSNILVTRLISYVDKMMGDHQCGFQHNRSTTDQIFCIRQILEENVECNETVPQLFIDSERSIIISPNLVYL